MTEIDSHEGVQRRILVVEDDRVIVALLEHRLTREGFEVISFSDGEDAHRWAEAERFDLAILDVRLPGMDGFELLENIRNKPHLTDVPVLMLTALGGESHVLRGLALGVNDYVTKPFSPKEVLARVRRLTDSMDALSDGEESL